MNLPKWSTSTKAVITCLILGCMPHGLLVIALALVERLARSGTNANEPQE